MRRFRKAETENSVDGITNSMSTMSARRFGWMLLDEVSIMLP